MSRGLQSRRVVDVNDVLILLAWWTWAAPNTSKTGHDNDDDGGYRHHGTSCPSLETHP